MIEFVLYDFFKPLIIFGSNNSNYSLMSFHSWFLENVVLQAKFLLKFLKAV